MVFDANIIYKINILISNLSNPELSFPFNILFLTFTRARSGTTCIH